MAIPAIDVLCIELDPATGFPASYGVNFDPFDLKITFPGGVKLEAVMEDPRQAAFKLLAQLMAALMPLQPIFDIFDAILIVKKVFDAISSNPFSIAGVLPEFFKIVDKLLQYIPALSVPKLIGSIIDVLIAVAVSLKTELAALASAQLRIDAAQVKGDALGGDIQVSMNLVIACGQAQLDTQLNIMKNKTAPLNRLMAILNLLGSIVGLPEIPGFDLTGSPAECVEALDVVIELLTTIRAAIPV